MSTRPILLPHLLALALAGAACGCGVIENFEDYQYLSGPNGWSGKTRFDDSSADRWLDVAAVSMDVARDPATNRAAIVDTLDEIKAARPGVQLVLFGETITGWYLDSADPEANRTYQQSVAEPVPGPTSELVAEAARRLELHVGFGIAERANDLLYNALVLVNPDGDVQAIHHKYLTVHSDVLVAQDAPYASGTGATTTEIDGIAVGLMICNDMHSATVARGFAAAGVQVVLSALADKSAVLPAGEWSPLAPLYDSWVVQANRHGTEGTEVYPGAISIIDPAGAIRASRNGVGWIAARIGVYR